MAGPSPTHTAVLRQCAAGNRSLMHAHLLTSGGRRWFRARCAAAAILRAG